VPVGFKRLYLVFCQKFITLVTLTFPGIVEPVSTGQAAKDYLTRTVTPTLLKGLTELCKMKPADPIVSLHVCNLYRFLMKLFFFLSQFSFFLQVFASILQ